ncbi:MAG: T9SS C-terminal target domain-containing protein [Bacteroidetes bacterium]|nr:MAG: T9SS C-terminal target domain-containing protein [Bacteroidota bacterium]
MKTKLLLFFMGWILLAHTAFAERNTFSMTFNVDLGNAIAKGFFNPASDFVDIAGNFNGWGDPANVLQQVGETSIYSFTTVEVFNVDQLLEFKFRFNGSWENAQPGDNVLYTIIDGVNQFDHTWATPTIGWANLQFPPTMEFFKSDENTSYTAYGRVWIDGHSGEGAVTGLTVWFGVNDENTNPANWTNEDQWEEAEFNVNVGNDAEYQFTIDANMIIAEDPGSYYYVFRYQYGLDEFVYGALGGPWDGENSNSGVITLNDYISAAIDPNAFTFGDFPDFDETGAFTTITWNDASSVEEVYIIIGEENIPFDFTVTDINNETASLHIFLPDEEDKKATFRNGDFTLEGNVVFDVGDAAGFTITFTDPTWWVAINVFNQENNMPIDNAQIYVQETEETFITGPDGWVDFTLSEGTYLLNISADGFEGLTDYQIEVLPFTEVNGDNEYYIGLTPVTETYTLTLTAEPAAGGNLTGAGNYPAGEEVVVHANSNFGYQFINWTQNGNEISNLSVFTFTMPAEDVTLTAHFETFVSTIGIIDDFETGVGLWWLPQGSGQTTGIILEDDEGNLLTYRTHETTIVNPATESTGSMKLAIVWDDQVEWTEPTPTGTHSHMVRQYMPPANANIPEKRFQPGQALEVWIYGDNSGNRFRFMVRDGNNTLEGSQWYNIDWSGWKRIVWDYNDDENVMGWVNGNGIMDGNNFYFDSFQITRDTEGTTSSATLYFDDLRIVNQVPVYFDITNADGSEIIIIGGIAYPAGQTSFNLFPGEYDFTVVKTGFIPFTGEFTLDYEPLSIDVTHEEGELLFSVIFNVDMNTAENFDPENDIVYLTGSMLGWVEPGTDPDNQAMSRVGDSWIWTKTLQLEAGIYGYKYFINAGWDNGEFNDREIIVTGDMETNDFWGFLGEPPVTYALTLVANPAEAGIVSGEGDFEQGTEVVVTATANEGFVFEYWSKDGIIQSYEDNYTFTMPAEDVTLVANFDIEEPPFYSLTLIANPVEGGAVSGDGLYQPGDEVNIIAAPFPGYLFVNWTENEEVISELPVHTYTMPASDVTLVANFEVDTEPIFITEFPWLEDFEGTLFPPAGWMNVNAEGPTVEWTLSTAQNHTPDGTQSAFHNYNLSAYQDGWLITPGLVIPEAGNYQLSFWSRNTFPSYYTKNSVLISTGSSDPDDEGYMEVWSPASVVNEWVETVLSLEDYSGETIYIAFRYEGFDGHAWYLDDVGVNLAPEPTFDVTFNVNMSTADNFDPENDIVYLTGSMLEWAVPGDDPDNQTMSRLGDSWIWTKTLQLEAGVYEYKYFLNAGWDNGEWPGGDNREIEVTEDMETNDSWGIIDPPIPTFTLTLEANPAEGGTVTGGGEYEEGETVAVSTIANEGFVFVNWTQNGTVIVSDPSLNFTMPASDVTLVANFEVLPPPTYTLTLQAEPVAGGTVQGAGEYEEGEEVTVTASPNTGYSFIKWTDEEDIEISTSESYDFTMPAMDVTLVAHFDIEESVSEFAEKSINVFPNPAENHFKISASGIIDRIVIADITGKVVYNRIVNNTEIHILSNFESGIYILNIYTKEGVFVRKLQIVD